VPAVTAVHTPKNFDISIDYELSRAPITRSGPRSRASVIDANIGRLGRWQAIPGFCDMPLLPEPNDLKQKFLSPVRAQAGYPFKVTVGEDRHGLFLLRSLRIFERCPALAG
jgi:hypothetical protein